MDLFAITTSDARYCLSETDCTALIYAHSLWLLSSESCHCTGNAPLSCRLYHMRKSTDESTPLSLTSSLHPIQGLRVGLQDCHCHHSTGLCSLLSSMVSGPDGITMSLSSGFTLSVPLSWNKLPTSAQTSETIKTFKKQLKALSQAQKNSACLVL